MSHGNPLILAYRGCRSQKRLASQQKAPPEGGAFCQF
jgi:hypothetical protein